MQLSLGQRVLDLERPRVMGVLNVTPDSFSDGGKFFTRGAALRHGLALAEAGADIIDVGGESTRPGASPVSTGEEIERVVPIIEALHKETEVAISIDTSKPNVMHAAVTAGASLINDVRALRQEGALDMASRLPAAICLMHMQGTPATMQIKPRYESVVDEVAGFLEQRVAACLAAGISRDRLILDPGFGFGKTDQHNLELLRDLERIASLGLPVLVGLSRKRTLGNLTGRATGDRVAAGLAAAVLAVERGAHIVRTHDVAATVDALTVIAALDEIPGRR